MQKLAKKLSLVMVALMTVFTALSYVPAKAATVVPQIQFAADQKTEFTAGERITFNLNAANYGGRVQYRVVLWNDNTKSYSDLWNTSDRYYANWMPYGNETLPLGWVINEPGSYRITVYVKRAGIANNKTAIASANCDSYQAGPAFVVKPAAPAVDANYEAAVKAVAAYEAAPLTTLEQVTAAEALKTPATTAVAAVADATKKAELTAKVTAQDAKVAAAKEALSYVTVKSVSTVNKNTLKVVFDKDVTATIKNFNVTEKDNAFSNLYVQKVAVDKNVATLTMFEDLDTDTTYVVEIKDVKSADAKAVLKEAVSKEFAYVETEAAKIELVKTTYEVGDEIEYKITDANGNDITNQYSFATDMEDPEDGEIVLETSSPSIVDIDNDVLTALAKGYSIVNLSIAGTELETKNTIVKVNDPAVPELTGLGEFDVTAAPDYSDPAHYMYLKDTDKVMNVKLLDQDEEQLTDVDDEVAGFQLENDDVVVLTYKSYDPTVLAVNVNTGALTPVSAGTARITVTATQYANYDLSNEKVVKKVSKTYSVDVKANPKATTLQVDNSTVKLVSGSDIPVKVKVTVLDQYGKKYVKAPVVSEEGTTYDKVSLAISNAKYTSIEDSFDDAELIALDADATGDDLKADLELKGKNADDATIATGTATLVIYPSADDVAGTQKLTVKYGTLSQTVSINVVKQATPDGYVAVLADKTLDRNTNDDFESRKGPQEANIAVYEKDTNGNYIAQLDFSNEDFDVVELTDDDDVLASATADDLAAVIAPETLAGDASNETGKATFAVKVGTATIAKYTVEVVNTTPVLTTATLSSDSLTVAKDASAVTVANKLFGTWSVDADGNDVLDKAGLFTGFDQYGKQIKINTADYKVFVSNGDVIDTALNTADKAGVATLIIKVAGKLYTIEVFVK